MSFNFVAIYGIIGNESTDANLKELWCLELSFNQMQFIFHQEAKQFATFGFRVQLVEMIINPRSSQ